jgi:hypothetical protein
MAIRRKRDYWAECAPSAGYGAAMGFMVGGGMAAIVRTTTTNDDASRCNTHTHQ